jgi:alkyl sulfatase BDS1-like metallo-beta-lactamase superfamily hydrolase
MVSDGIGPSFNRQGVAPGTVSLVPPTVEVTRTGQTMTIDGVEFEFQLTPNTEAPAEMTIYLPQLRVLDMAEIANGSLHNILDAARRTDPRRESVGRRPHRGARSLRLAH